MATTSAHPVAPDYPEDYHIPIDLFVSKKHPGVARGNIGFADSGNKIVFRVEYPKPSLPRTRFSSKRILLLFDHASDTPLISMYYDEENGYWQGYSGESKVLKFNAKWTKNALTRKELHVFVVGQNEELPSEPNFKAKGFPFQRSCAIYTTDSITAQTSLMYKLNQMYVGRKKFRVTIFPQAANDHPLIAAIVTIFVYGKRRSISGPAV